MSFDAGALVFKLQTLGAEVFRKDQADAKAAIEGTSTAAKTAKTSVDGLGTATEQTGKKARAAKQPIQEQAAATEQLGKKTRTTSDEQQRNTKVTKEQIDAAGKLSTGLLVAGTAVAALVTLSVAKYASFDQEMSNVAAATMATAAEQKRLADAALDAGAKTAYSANEAAEAEEELAKAGQSVADIVGGSLNGALALAAAGQLAVARSAEIMATTLTQFGLKADKASHVSDLLAAGAGKAQGSVDDLALALEYVGPVAAGLKISLEETTGTLALFASQGILGQKAGTGLRGVLMALTAPSSAAQKTMAAYGISVFDAQGNMRSMSAIAQSLQDKLGGLTEAERSEALGRIFGNEQITAARVLYAGGAKAVEDWTAKVNDSGYAAEQAAKRQDNLAGDIEKLGGAFDTALIKTGSGANDVLRDMTQAVTGLVDGFSDLPSGVQQTALVVGIAAAAVLLLYGGTLKAASGITHLLANLKVLNVSMKTTALVAGGVSIAIAGIVTVVGLLAAAQADAEGRAKSYADALRDGGDAADTMYAALQEVNHGALGIQDFGSAADAAETLGLSLGTVTDAIKGVKSASDDVSKAIQAGRDGFNQWTGEGKDASNAADVLEQAVTREAEAFRRGKHDVEQLSGAQNEGADSARSAADAYLDESKNADKLSDTLGDLLDQINKLNGVNQDAISANLDYKDALAKVRDEAKHGKDAWGESTQAGRDHKEMLIDLAKKSQDAAKAQFDVDQNTDSYLKKLKSGRQDLINNAIAMGASKDQAVKLADAVYGIPSKAEVDVIAKTQEAQKQLDGITAALSYIDNKDPVINVRVKGAGKLGGPNLGFADGGPIAGPGTSTSDSILAWLSNGEHIITAREVQAAGGHAAVEAWRRSLAAPGFKLGGAVGIPRYATGGAADAATFRDLLEQWLRAQRRGENREAGLNGNGLSLVDKLFDIADQSSKAKAKKLDAIALKSEKQFLKLEKQADAAASKLDAAKEKLSDLKDAAASMVSRVASAVRSLFNVGDLTKTVSTETVSRNGVLVTGPGPGAAGIASRLSTTAARIKQFADKLKQLAQKGLSPALLAEIASLGVENGEPVVDALLTATAGEISSINTSYAAIDAASTQAGQTVSDANYKDLITAAESQVTAAQKGADQITKQLTKETDRIIKAITGALKTGAKKAYGGPILGPGTGISDSIPIMASNGEHMWTAQEVAAAGGHQNVARIRQAVLAGSFHAIGGPITTSTAPFDALTPRTVHLSGPVDLAGPVELSDRTLDKLARRTAAIVRTDQRQGVTSLG